MSIRITNPFRVVVTKALAAAGDYAAEDVLSESAAAGTAWTFAGVAAESAGYGEIQKAIVSCETTGAGWTDKRVTLYLFNAAPSTNLNDNVANAAPSNADVTGDKYLGKIDFSGMSDLGGNCGAIATPSTTGGLPLLFKCAAASTTIYGILVVRDAVTGEVAGDDMTVILEGEKL